jgi:hypothetical protein
LPFNYDLNYDSSVWYPVGTDLPPENAANQEWALDFIHDAVE